MTILTSDSATQLRDRLQQLRPGTRPLWGKMNANQMVCHLHDTMKLALGERAFEDRSTLLSRTVQRWVAFHLPLPWPKNYPTRPEFDQLVGGTPPSDFARDTAALVAVLQRFVRQPRDFHFGRHPIFGEMTEWEWMRWAYRHADHHFRQFGI